MDSQSPSSVEATRPARIDPGVVDAIRRIALEIALSRGTVTADDVRQAMPHVPHKRCAFGAAFMRLQQEGKLIEAGYEPSRIPSNHGRRIKVYRPRQVKACLTTLEAWA